MLWSRVMVMKVVLAGELLLMMTALLYYPIGCCGAIKALASQKVPI